MLDILLFDVDETLLDFSASERNAFFKIMEKLGVRTGEEMLSWYHRCNQQLWKRFERGEIDRPAVLYGRFEQLLAQYEITGLSPVTVQETFVESLAEEAVLIDGAIPILKALGPKYQMYIVTNGVARSQRSRLRVSGLDQYVDDIFISEELGSQKPQKAFFDACFARIGEPDRQRVMIIGDSLTSDIRGGNLAGIHTCWYHPPGAACTEDVKIDCELTSLWDLPELLRTFDAQGNS